MHASRSLLHHAARVVWRRRNLLVPSDERLPVRRRLRSHQRRRRHMSVGLTLSRRASGVRRLELGLAIVVLVCACGSNASKQQDGGAAGAAAGASGGGGAGGSGGGAGGAAGAGGSAGRGGAGGTAGASGSSGGEAGQGGGGGGGGSGGGGTMACHSNAECPTGQVCYAGIGPCSSLGRCVTRRAGTCSACTCLDIDLASCTSISGSRCEENDAPTSCWICVIPV